MHRGLWHNSEASHIMINFQAVLDQYSYLFFKVSSDIATRLASCDLEISHVHLGVPCMLMSSLQWVCALRTHEFAIYGERLVL